MSSLGATLSNNGKHKTKIKLCDIRENPLNFYEKDDVYKKTIDKETGEDIELLSLAEGIRNSGQMHNVVVYENTDINDGKKYTLISGARRYKAMLYNHEHNNGVEEIDALIVKKPQNEYEERLLIIEGNKQRRREFQSKTTAYQEVLSLEQIYDNYKKDGLIEKGQITRRKFVAQSLGISEGTVENLHHQFDKKNSENNEETATKKPKRRQNKQTKKKNKYAEVANEIANEVSFACSNVELTEKTLIFSYETLEDLEHLLDSFSIDVDLSNLKEWLLQNS